MHRTRRSHVRLIRPLSVLAALSTASAWAQTAPPPPAPALQPVRPVQDPAQQFIEQQRAQARQRALQQAPAPVYGAPGTSGTTLAIAPGTPVDRIVETGPTFRVGKIVLVSPGGMPFVPPRGVSRPRLDAIVEPFVGHRLGSHRINVLLKWLSDAFIQAGYVTTRAVLGPQNLESGTLTVTIQLGRIERYAVNGKPIAWLKAGERSAGGGWLTDAGYENAFPAAPGAPLRLADLDEGAAQINRLRRNQAEVQILPGQTPGDSIVDVVNKPGDALYYSLGVDNYGSTATGLTRYRAGIEADNLLGLQESLSVNYIDSLDSNALVGSFAVPFGRHTFSYTVSDSEYQQLIGTTALLYGRTLSHIFGWSETLDRTLADIVNVDATLSWRRTDRVVNGIDLDPQHIAVLRVGGNWLHKFAMNDAAANVTLDAGVSRGLPWFEADHDAPDIDEADAHSQFTKLDATGTYALPLPRLGRLQLAYRGALGGQWTDVALFGSEQLYLGGMDTIRGFRSGDLVGDRGIWSRNELAWVNAPSWRDSRIEPYVFLDAGKANLIAVPGFPTLAGAGAGVRVQWQWHGQLLSAEVTAGRQLARPAALGPKGTLVLATLNWND